MAALMPLGLTIDKDNKSIQSRKSDLRGYIDSDIPLLESFRILKDGKSPDDFNISPEDYRSFINWLINGPAHPVPTVPLRIMCYYRMKLESGMNDLVTTDGMRLKQENIVKTIDEMIRGGNHDTDPILMCATGGSAAPSDSDCCNEIKPKIDELKTLISNIKTGDYSEKFEELKTQLSDMKSCPQGQADLVEKIKAIIPSSDSTMISDKIDALDGKIQTLTNLVADTISTEIGTTLKNTTDLLKILTEARGNIGKLLTKPEKSGLEIRAAEITEKAEAASREAELALAELNRVKSDNNKTVEEIEEAIDVASTARNKADSLISEAQQLWELISPSDNSSSSSAEGASRPNGPILVKPDVLTSSSEQTASKAPNEVKEKDPEEVKKMVGGRGSTKDKAPINTALVRVRALSDSVSDAKRILREKRAKKVKNSSDKDSIIADLREKIKAAEAELAELHRRLGEKSTGLKPEATALEEKVTHLTALLKQITGDVPDLNKAVANHVKADAEQAESIKTLQVQIAGLPNQEELKTKLQGIITKIEKLEHVDWNIEELKETVAAAVLTHDEDLKENGKLRAELDRLKGLLTPLQTKYDDISLEYTNLQQELASAVADIKGLTGQIKGSAGIEEELKRVSAEKASIETGINTTKNDVLKPLQRKYDELSAEYSRLQQELASAVGDVKGLTSQIKGSANGIPETLKKIEAEKASIKEELDSKNESLEALQTKYDQLNSEHTTLQQELEVAIADVKRLTAQIKEGTNMDEIAEQLRRVTAEKASLAEELAITKENLQRRTEELGLSRAEIEKLRKQAGPVSEINETALRTLREEKEAALAKLHISEVQLAAANAHSEENNRLAKAAEAQVAILTKQIESLRNRISELESEKGSNRAAAADMSDHHRQVELNISVHLDEVRREKARLESELEEAKRNEQDYSQKLAASEGTVQSLREQQTRFQAESARELAFLKEQIRGLTTGQNNDLENVRDKLQQAIAEKEALRAQKDKNNDSWYKAHSDQVKIVSELNIYIEELKNQHKEEIRNLELRIGAANTQSSAELQNVIASLKNQLQQLLRENVELEEEIERLQALLRNQTTPNIPVPSVKVTKKAGIPSYMRNTETRKSYYNETQKQLGPGRISHGSTYAANPAKKRKGGSKGAKFAKTPKKILPLY
jgi:chromosome segregation ATPase